MEPPSPRPRPEVPMFPGDDYDGTQQLSKTASATTSDSLRPPPIGVVLVTKKPTSSLATPSTRIAKKSLPKQIVTSTSGLSVVGGPSGGPSFRLQPRGLNTVLCTSPDVSSPAASQRSCRGRKRRAPCLATSCGATPSTLATKGSFSPCSSRGEGGDAALNTSDEENSLSSTSITSPRANETQACDAAVSSIEGSMMMAASPLRMDSLTIQSPRDTRSGALKKSSPRRSPLSLKQSASPPRVAAASVTSVRHHPGSSFILYASSPASSMFVRPRSSSVSSSVTSPGRSSIFMNSPASSARSTPKYAPLTVLQQSDESRRHQLGPNEASSPPTRPSTTSVRRRLDMDYSPASSTSSDSPVVPDYGSLRVLPGAQRMSDMDISVIRPRSNSLNSPPSARRKMLSNQCSPFSSSGAALSTPKQTPPLGLHQRKRPQRAAGRDVILGVDFVKTPPKTQRGTSSSLFSSLEDGKLPAAGAVGAKQDSASEVNGGFQVPLPSPQTRKRTFHYHSPSPRTPVRPEASPMHHGSALSSSAKSTPLPKVTLTPRSCPSSANGRHGLPSFPSPSDIEVYSSNFLVEQKPSNKRRCPQLAISSQNPSDTERGEMRGTFLLPRTRAKDGFGSEASSIDASMRESSGPHFPSEPSSLACKSANSATEATESTTNSKHSSSLGSPSSRFLPQPRKSSYLPLPGRWLSDSHPTRSSASLLNLTPSSSSSLLRPTSSSGMEYMVAAAPSNADDGSVLTSDNDDDDEDAFILAAPGVLEEERQQQQLRDVERARQRRRHSTEYDDLHCLGGQRAQQQDGQHESSPYFSSQCGNNGRLFSVRTGMEEAKRVVDSNGSHLDDMDLRPSDLIIPDTYDDDVVGRNEAMVLQPQLESGRRSTDGASRDEVLTTPPPPAVTDSSQLSPPLLSTTRSVHE